MHPPGFMIPQQCRRQHSLHIITSIYGACIEYFCEALLTHSPSYLFGVAQKNLAFSEKLSQSLTMRAIYWCVFAFGIFVKLPVDRMSCFMTGP
jgi:hypothetical protein